MRLLVAALAALVTSGILPLYSAEGDAFTRVLTRSSSSRRAGRPPGGASRDERRYSHPSFTRNASSGPAALTGPSPRSMLPLNSPPA